MTLLPARSFTLIKPAMLAILCLAELQSHSFLSSLHRHNTVINRLSWLNKSLHLWRNLL
jgi:hypothetical protein